MSLSGTQNWKIYTLTFLRKYSFFVKTFILWTSITIPWYTYSFLMLKLEKSSVRTELGLDTFGSFYQYLAIMKIEIISFTVNGTQVNYTCHERIEKWSSWVDVMKLWLGGIIPMTISTIGIIFNILSFIVLRKCQGNKTFKKLLMSLGKKNQNMHRLTTN